MSILSKPVSYYPSKNATAQGVTVNLLTILQSNKHREIILRLRQETDEAVQKQLKENLPCYAVAGIFNRRCNNGLLLPSGLACIDFDGADGCDLPYIFSELRKLDCIAYAGLSCRGQRPFAIVPFLYPHKYEKHYERLIKSFIDWGLPMGDPCHKKISQPRFVSWNDDSTQFFNHEAKPFCLLPTEKTYHYLAKPTYSHTGADFRYDTDTQIEFAVKLLVKQGNYFCEGNKHIFIFNLCRLLNKMGVSKVKAERYISQNLMPLSEVKSNCIEYPYKYYTAEAGTWRRKSEKLPQINF